MISDFGTVALLTGLIGGLALFLFGIDIMTRALKQVAGASMKSILERMTGNPLKGMAAGAMITAIIQSSSVTTVLLVGFISAGLMTMAQSVPMILGANIGSTMTAQLLAFKVSEIGLPVLAVGFFVSFVAPQKAAREYGRILLGLGLVFFGMSIMSDGMAPLRGYPPFLTFMQSMENVVLAALVGAAFTAVIQSSAATTGILIVMAGQGLIDLNTAIALALGANIGTCVTAGLAAIGKPREAIRAAVVHTIFNVVGVVIWIGFVDQLAELARLASSLTGSTSTDANIPRQLANVHTLFNVINAFLFVGFTKQIAQLAEWLIPDKQEIAGPEYAAKHLDPEFLNVPALALDAARLEILHLGSLVLDMLKQAVPAVTTGSPLDIDRLRVMDRPVDLLHREIVGYMRQIGSASLPTDQAAVFMRLIRISNDLEHIGDLVATSMVASARKRIDEGVDISPTTASVIASLHREVAEAMEGVLTALSDQSSQTATSVRATKSGISELIEGIARHEVERLRSDDPKRLQTYAREIELTEMLDDIYKVIRRIAKSEILIFKDASPT